MDITMIGTTVSHYKILEKLGEGGMGVVYKAEDLKLTRMVALKFLPHGLDSNEPERARFLQEARAAAILNHPNICTVYDIQEHEGQQFIVMEYVEGKTLREIVPVKKMQDAISYAVQIGAALQEAHVHGIVHRDIKAENIMVNSKNQVKVMDFGLAKLKGSLKLTKTSSTIGTLAYMAPEQIEGEEVDARSDIFSCGIVLYEMLTGHLPFRGEHEAAMVYAIVNEEPEPLQTYVPDAPSELLHVLGRALEKDREERYQSVQEMLIELRRIKKDSTRVSRQPGFEIPSFGTTVVEPAGRQKRGWRRALWIGTAALVVLCVISTVWLILRPHPARLNPNRTTGRLKLPATTIGYPSLSTDGNWVVFSAYTGDGKWDVFWMNLATGKATRVTNESAYYIEGCSISPDVSQIAYDFWNGSKCPNMVKLVASQGGESRTLADTGMGPKWTPDGQRIGYCRVGTAFAPSVSGKFEIWSIKPDGTDNRHELTDSVSMPRSPCAFCWSPDGGSITWIRNWPENYGEVMVRELATGRQRQLTFDRKTVDEVVWASNDMILFISNRSGQSSLWMIPASGGEATQVTQGGAPILGARISADTRTLVYMQREQTNPIWISSIDGSNAYQVTSADVKAISASFSPDGKFVACVLGEVDVLNQESHLYVMDRGGKNQRQLSFGSERVMRCIWSPDGRWLAYASRALDEPDDSSRVYLIQPFNPSPPRLLCKGIWQWWADSENLVVFSQMKTLQHPIRGGKPIQLYQDSTFVYAIGANNRLVYYDLRIGREGLWTGAINGSGERKGEVTKLSIDSDLNAFAASLDHRSIIFVKPTGDDMWRVWTSTGMEERIGTALPGWAAEFQAGSQAMFQVSSDGREVVWNKYETRGKLLVVKDVFE
jgi:serine/threonine protein kinase/Tol biopolymer transport system component